MTIDSGNNKSGDNQANTTDSGKKPDIKSELNGVIEKISTLAENQVTDKVKESANQIWLAGLGAYSKAEKEGTKLFDALVRDGERLENKTRDFVDRQINVAKDQVEAAKDKVDEVRAKATGSWGKVEKAFDQRVSNALHRLDIPTKLDFDDVSDRIDALGEQIRSLADRRKLPLGNPSDKTDQ
ncbi:MAG: phasin family protein [Pseudomonadales bacterium]|nr:phasin family protein [Pseudomonadales bacterium]